MNIGRLLAYRDQGGSSAIFGVSSMGIIGYDKLIWTSNKKKEIRACIRAWQACLLLLYRVSCCSSGQYWKDMLFVLFVKFIYCLMMLL